MSFGVAESKVARRSLVLAALVFVSFVARPERRPHLLDAEQRAHAFRFAAELRASEIAARCEREALREPRTGDGSALLFPLADPASAERRCMKVLSDYRLSRPDCELDRACPPEPLATLVAPPGLDEVCAPLHAAISELAHATEACSPYRPGRDADLLEHDAFGAMYTGDAVRVHIAPLVARGELGAAARHVIDAMRYVHDYGRHAALVVTTMFPEHSLARTLDELLADPRLTVGDAREIARGLSVLVATQPSFLETMLAETAWLVRELHRQPFAEADDPDEHRALHLLAAERWLYRIVQRCTDSPRACADRLPGPSQVPEDIEDAGSAEQAIAILDDQRAVFHHYTKHFIERDVRLRQLLDLAIERGYGPRAVLEQTARDLIDQVETAQRFLELR